MNNGPKPLEPGQWFCGTGEDDRVAAARALLDAGQEALSDPNPARFAKMLVGTAAGRVLAKAAENAPNMGMLLAQMVADLEDNTMSQFANLTAETDPASDAARKAHFAIRVNRQILLTLEKYVVLGNEAHQQLNNQEE